MVTGALRNRIDRVWDAFWSGGIANPLEAIEQITYLMFLKRLDSFPLHTEGTAHLRWTRFTGLAPDEMFAVVRDDVFPWLRTLGGDDSAYARHMRDARFTIPTATLLAKAVDLIDELPLAERDTEGDLYEYMLGKIAAAGQNGQFRTPRHIIQLIVDMMAPGPEDDICDPACGTAGFLVAAAEYAGQASFHGFDFDRTMLRIASMNMLLHGVERPDIRYRDSLAEAADAGRYSMILANPPFAGSLDQESTAADLQRTVRTRKTELLFLALILRQLRPGGRAAVIVPDGVLFGATRAHRDLRRLLVENHRLEAVVKLPSGVFRPYAGVSTAILFFTRTDGGGTDHVWFYDVAGDGFSLDDRRAPHAADDLPDVLARWAHRDGSERERQRTDRSFCVPREEIAARDYDLSLKRYKRTVPERVTHRSPAEILANLERLETEIVQGLAELKDMLR